LVDWEGLVRSVGLLFSGREVFNSSHLGIHKTFEKNVVSCWQQFLVQQHFMPRHFNVSNINNNNNNNGNDNNGNDRLE